MAAESWSWSSAALDVLGEAVGVFRVDRGSDGSVRNIVMQEHNRTAQRLLSRWFTDQETTCYGLELGELNLGRIHEQIRTLVIAVADGGATVQRRISAGRDETQWWEITVHPIDDDRVTFLARDISEMVRQERMLESAYDNAAGVRATLQTALDATSDCFAVYDVGYGTDLTPVALHLVMINVAGAEPFGVPDDLIGMDLREYYPRAEQTGLWGAICQAVVNQTPTTYRLKEYDEDGVWLTSWDNTIAPVSSDQVVVTWRNVTEEERRQRQLAVAHDQAQYAALHDELTGLAKRVLLEERLAQSLRTSDADERLAIAFCDLDGFKEINDTLGHQVGDDVLRAVATRLVSAVRSGDTVARVGGDEFVLLLRGLPLDWDVDGFMSRIRSITEERLDIEGLSGGPRLSVGVAVAPPERRNPEVLLRLADERMYEDKMRRRASRPRTAAPPRSGDEVTTTSR